LEAERVQGGSWNKFEYGNRDKREPHLERYLVGLITKEFQKSSKLYLPEASVRFEDSLGYFLQNEYAPNVCFKAEGFKALKSQDSDVPVDTTLLAEGIGLGVRTARSSLEGRGSLCLSIYGPLPVQSPKNAKPQITRKTSNDADCFSQIEIIKWGSWMSEDTWIVEGTNRYFIPEPSPPKHDKSTAKEVKNDARKSVSTPARAHGLRYRSKLLTKIYTEAGRASVEKADLQTSKEDSLGGHDSTQSGQAKEKASPPSVDGERKTPIAPRPNTPEIPTSALMERLEENPPPDSSPAVVASEENPAKNTKVRIDTIILEDCISAGERPASAEKMPSTSQQTSGTKTSTTRQDNPEIHANAILPKKGLYVWISSDRSVKSS
jgi:hypothetical protein